QIACGRRLRWARTSSIRRRRTRSTSNWPAARRFAPPPLASAITVARSSASWQTVFVPPASMPNTCITVAQVWYIPAIPQLFRRVFASRHPRRRIHLVWGATIVLSLFGYAGLVARAATDAPIRGYWVSRNALVSLDAIRRSVSIAQSGGFD